jgi:glucose-1-phosphate thymidylyltransferase
VKAILLCAGYATRLYPLTEQVPKMLLPVGGRPVLDWLWERLQEVPDLETTHLVTNARFAPAFREWADRRGVEVHDDGTTSNDDRLGAIGDIQLVIDRAGLVGSDLLVAAGDNLFDFSLRDFVEWWRAKDGGSALAVYDVEERELARQYGIVELDGDERAVSMIEKPEEPPSTLAATATYLYHRDHVELVRSYLDDGNTPDAPGNFLVWLHSRAPVYGYRFSGEWIDIGDREQLREADNRLRRRLGLPERAAYSLDTN